MMRLDCAMLKFQEITNYDARRYSRLVTDHQNSDLFSTEIHIHYQNFIALKLMAQLHMLWVELDLVSILLNILK